MCLSKEIFTPLHAKATEIFGRALLVRHFWNLSNFVFFAVLALRSAALAEFCLYLKLAMLLFPVTPSLHVCVCSMLRLRWT
jgi:hypothetical protein